MWQLVVLLLVSVLASPTAQYEIQGTALINSSVSLSIPPNAEFSLFIPDGVTATNNRLMVQPGFVIDGTPYFARRTVTFTERDGAPRLNEYAKLTFAHNGKLHGGKDIRVLDSTGREVKYKLDSYNSTHANLTILTNVTYSYNFASIADSQVLVGPNQVKIEFPAHCEGKPISIEVSIASVNSPGCWWSLDGSSHNSFTPVFESNNTVQLGELNAGLHELVLGCDSGSFVLKTGTGTSAGFYSYSGAWVRQEKIPVGRMVVPVSTGCSTSYSIIYDNEQEQTSRSVELNGNYTKTYEGFRQNTTYACTLGMHPDPPSCIYTCNGPAPSATFTFSDAPEDMEIIKIEGYHQCDEQHCKCGGDCGGWYYCGFNTLQMMFNHETGSSETVCTGPNCQSTITQNPGRFFNQTSKTIAIYSGISNNCGNPAPGIKSYSRSVRLQGSHRLGVSVSAEEETRSAYVAVRQGGSTLLPSGNTVSVDTSPGEHALSIESNAAQVFVTSSVVLKQNSTAKLNATIIGSNIVWQGEIENKIGNGNLSMFAPNGNIIFQDDTGIVSANYDGSKWSVNADGRDKLWFNFTAPKINLLFNLQSPRLSFVPSGVPSSESARACFGALCYLSYNYSEMRNITRTGVANLADPVTIVVSAAGAELFAGNSSNTTSMGAGRLSFSASGTPGEQNLGVYTRSNDWSGGVAYAQFNISSLDVSLTAASTIQPGQVSFSGTARRGGVPVLGTVLAALHDGASTTRSVFVNLTNGNFSGSIEVPSTGTYTLRAIALDPPEDEQIFGTASRDIKACYSSGACTKNSDCCSGTCCNSVCSSSCSNSNQNLGSGQNSGSGASGTGNFLNNTGIPPLPPVQLDPTISAFMDAVADARRFGDEYPDMVSAQAQEAILSGNITLIESFTSQLRSYVVEQQSVTRDRIIIETSSPFLNDEEKARLLGYFTQFSSGRMSLPSLLDAEAQALNLTRQRESALVEELKLWNLDPGSNPLELANRTVADSGNSAAMELFRQGKFVTALRRIRTNQTLTVPEEEKTITNPPESAPEQKPFEVPVASLVVLPVLVTSGIVIRHIIYWG